MGDLDASSAPRRGRIPGLDGLRAIFLGLVLFSHLAGTRGFPLTPIFERVGNVGHLGSRAFFVMSGFLITRLLLQEHRRTGGVSLRRFYFRRTLRIFPALYVFLFAVLGAEQLGWLRLEPGDALAAFTFMMNHHHERAWWLGHLWSLSVEEQFYLLWPLLLAVLGPRRRVGALIAMIAGAPLARIGIWYLFPWFRVGIGESFATVGDSIAVGCLLTLLEGRLDASGAYQAFIRSPFFVLAPISAFVANYLAPHARLNMVIGETVMYVAIAVTIDRCVRLADGRVGRILEWRPLAYVGTLSYSVYLWQQLFLNRSSDLPVNAFPQNLALTVVAALLSHYLVEKPGLRLRMRLEAARTRPTAAA